MGKSSQLQCLVYCAKIFSPLSVLTWINCFRDFPISKWRLFQIGCQWWNDVTVLISGEFFSGAHTQLAYDVNDDGDKALSSRKLNPVTSSPKWPNFHCKINSFPNANFFSSLLSLCSLFNLQHLFSKLRKILLY